MTRAEIVQVLGGLIASASLALYSVTLGGLLLGTLCVVYGLAMERA